MSRVVLFGCGILGPGVLSSLPLRLTQLSVLYTCVFMYIHDSVHVYAPG